MEAAARATLSMDLARLKDGDRAAARPVFAALWPVLVCFARRTLDDDGAEEAAQRAIVRLFAQLDRYDVERDALSWAYAIAVWEVRSLLRDHTRARARSASAHGSTQPDAHAGSDHGALQRIAAACALPEDATSERQLRALLDAAVDSLSDADRRTLLELLEDADPQAPLSARLRQRRHRAIGRLRTIWKDRHGT